MAWRAMGGHVLTGGRGPCRLYDLENPIWKHGEVMAKVKDTILNYAEHLAAENWAGLARLQRLYGFNRMQHLDMILTGAALTWAEGTEPRRSAKFTAIITLLEMTHDDRLADAQQARHEAEK